MSVIGFLTITILLYLVLSKKTTIHFALVIVPTITALILGVSVANLGEYMTDGLASIAETGIMLTFAVLFFGIMFDAGLFDPIIKNVIKISKGDPIKIAVGTAIIGFASQLDGSGSSTFLITVSSMLPVYLAIGMSPITLAVITGLASGAMNLVPWGGPTIRAATSLNIDVMELWVPMIPVQLVGMALVVLASIWLGKKEKDRLGKSLEGFQSKGIYSFKTDEEDKDTDELKRPKLFLVNLILTILVIVVLVMSILPLSITFILAMPIALMINYRDTGLQQKRIEAHAKSAIYTASIIFSAGIFIGIFTGTGMIDAMAETLAQGIPESWGGAFPYILAFASMPLTVIFDPDSFYFGILPILTSTAEMFGVDPMSMGRAAIIGQTTLGAAFSPLVGSTWLLIGLAGVHMGDVQKRGIPIAFSIAAIMSLTAIILGLL